MRAEILTVILFTMTLCMAIAIVGRAADWSAFGLVVVGMILGATGATVVLWRWMTELPSDEPLPDWEEIEKRPAR
jgi:hypothetical protein